MPSTNERRSSAQTRERVLEVTHGLFYWHGIHATGVDAVASAADVAPTTLYRLFGSKDGLVAAYVERAGALYREWLDQSLGSTDRPARERLLDLFASPRRAAAAGELPRVSVPDGARGDPR